MDLPWEFCFERMLKVIKNISYDSDSDMKRVVTAHVASYESDARTKAVKKLRNMQNNSENTKNRRILTPKKHSKEIHLTFSTLPSKKATMHRSMQTEHKLAYHCGPTYFINDNSKSNDRGSQTEMRDLSFSRQYQVSIGPKNANFDVEKCLKIVLKKLGDVTTRQPLSMLPESNNTVNSATQTELMNEVQSPSHHYKSTMNSSSYLDDYNYESFVQSSPMIESKKSKEKLEEPRKQVTNATQTEILIPSTKDSSSQTIYSIDFDSSMKSSAHQISGCFKSELCKDSDLEDPSDSNDNTSYNIDKQSSVYSNILKSSESIMSPKPPTYKQSHSVHEMKTESSLSNTLDSGSGTVPKKNLKSDTVSRTTSKSNSVTMSTHKTDSVPETTSKLNNVPKSTQSSGTVPTSTIKPHSASKSTHNFGTVRNSSIKSNSILKETSLEVTTSKHDKSTTTDLKMYDGCFQDENLTKGSIGQPESASIRNEDSVSLHLHSHDKTYSEGELIGMASRELSSNTEAHTMSMSVVNEVSSFEEGEVPGSVCIEVSGSINSLSSEARMLLEPNSILCKRLAHISGRFVAQ